MGGRLPPIPPGSFDPFRAQGRDGRQRARIDHWMRSRRASTFRHIVSRTHRKNPPRPGECSVHNSYPLKTLDTPVVAGFSNTGASMT
jgi:hypothetical protein